MDYSFYSRSELENMLRRRDNKIKKQAKQLLKFRSGIYEKTDNELIEEIGTLKNSEEDYIKVIEEMKDEIEEQKDEIMELLSLV